MNEQFSDELFDADEEDLLDYFLEEEGYDVSITNPIKLVNREGDLPLSFAQQRLWFLEQFETNSSIYNIPLALKLTGNLNLEALEYALNKLVDRHESLRTTFTTELGVPRQVINPSESITISFTNLNHLPENEREIEVEKLAIEEAKQPFDLEIAPLLRVNLFQLEVDTHVLLFVIHHIITDGWSNTIFMKELMIFYIAYFTGEDANLAKLSIQYADFAQWQREHLEGDVLESLFNYWQQQLVGSPPLFSFPSDYPRPSVQTYRGKKYTFDLSSDLVQKLELLSQQEEVTLFMTLLTVFKILLYRYTHQTDIVVGSVIANRNYPQLDDLIGFFVNTLVLRTELSDKLTFRQLLHRVSEITLNAYEHQDLPFEVLVDKLNPKRDLSYSPLFQVMFVLQNMPVVTLELPDLTITPLEIESTTTKFDMILFIEKTETNLKGVIEYSTDLFNENTITQIANHFLILLKGCVVNPDHLITSFSILSSKEQQQLLVAWNNTQTTYPKQATIHQLFEFQVEKTPDKVAVIFEDKELTYRELNGKANQLAHRLRDLGVGAEIFVGIYAERSFEMIIGLLGILKAGGAYVPLEVDYPAERLKFILLDTNVTVLLTQAHLLEKLSLVFQDRQFSSDESSFITICLDKDWSQISQYSCDNLFCTVTSKQLAYITYTSGSTGKPKGASIPHQGVVRLVKDTNYINITANETFLQFAPLAFDASTLEIWAPLLNGACLVVVPPQAISLDRLGLIIRKRKVTTLWLTSNLFNLMVDERLDDLQFVQQLLAGGDVLSVSHVQKVLKQLKGCQLINGYGPTENTTFTCCFPVKSTDQIITSVPIGRPIANTTIYILDQNLHPVPIGVAGELYIGGDGLARNYFNRPRLTATSFIPNPFVFEEKPTVEGERMYKTGDLARYLSTGEVEFLGRIDYQVKIRGFRIELGEIEIVLAQHAFIQQCLVLARKDKNNRKQLVAYVILVQELKLDTQTIFNQLRQFLKTKLPDYMIPTFFVILNAFPLTPNGKIDRSVLPMPDTNLQRTTKQLVLPHTEIEETLTEIWKQVLDIKQLSIHDSFFDLGGDSILSLQIIARARQVNIHLTPKQVFQYQTIAELANVATPVTEIKNVQDMIIGFVPLTPIQHWFFEQDLAEPYHWNQSMLLKLKHSLDQNILKQTIHYLLIHHDALRLRFQKTERGWQQHNAEIGELVPFTTITLSKIEQSELLKALLPTLNKLQSSLNLSEGPLINVTYLNFEDSEDAYLFIAIHHLVVDGVSWRVLLEDLQTVYQQLSRNQSVTLPLKTTAFKQWAESLQQYTQSTTLKEEINYWLKVCETTVTQLPLDFSVNQSSNVESLNTEASAQTITVTLNDEETQALLQEVPKAYNTQINDILLTALVQTFAEWTGSSQLLIDLEGHGREDIIDGIDLSRTVGWFTSIFPVYLDLANWVDLGECIKSIKEQLRTIPQQGIGYGMLRYLSNDSILAKQLTVQPPIAFNYLGQFDTILGSDSLFESVNQELAGERSPLALRRHLLSIDSYISDGRLSVGWTYSQNLHQSQTIHHLAQNFIKALQTLIIHCQSPQASGYTPSDFPNMQFEQSELDTLLDEFDTDLGDIL